MVFASSLEDSPNRPLNISPERPVFFARRVGTASCLSLLASALREEAPLAALGGTAEAAIPTRVSPEIEDATGQPVPALLFRSAVVK